MQDIRTPCHARLPGRPGPSSLVTWVTVPRGRQ